MRFKNGVQVQAGHPEGFEVIQFCLNSAQVAAEIVAVGDFPLPVRFPVGLFAPFPVYFPAGRHPQLFPGKTEKPVGENLVQYAAAEPFGRCKAGFIYRKLPRLAVLRKDGFSAPCTRKDTPAGLRIRAEPIKIKAGLRRSEMAFPPFVLSAVHAAPKHAKRLPFPCRVVRNQKPRRRTVQAAGHGDFKMNRGSGRDRARGAAVNRVSRIKH